MILIVFAFFFAAGFICLLMELQILVVAVWIFLILTIMRGGLLLYYSGLPNFSPKTDSGKKRNDFVSILISTYNEPPVILKNTLRSLSKLDYEFFEVLVLDSNTKDREIWQPIADFCRGLGPKFKFFHEEELKGFKAGALNYLIRRISGASKFLMTVDADYQVDENFLNEALIYFTDDRIGFVQFPQAYFNIFPKNQGIALEYEHFFSLYMNMANHFSCVNTTGTLTVFRTEPLKRIGLYNSECLTEDADIGARLLLNGPVGVYVPKITGNGLVPYDLEAYRKQKSRWSIGNAQILKKNILLIMRADLKLGQKLGLIAQLTAWFNFIIIPLAFLGASFLVTVMEIGPTWTQTIVMLASFDLAVFIIFKFLTFAFLFHKSYPINVILRGVLVHLGMASIYGGQFWKIFFQKNLVFERTNKFILPKMPSVIRNTFEDAILGTIFLIFAWIFLQEGNLFNLFSALLAAVVFFLIFYVRKEINPTKKYSAALLQQLEKSF